MTPYGPNDLEVANFLGLLSTLETQQWVEKVVIWSDSTWSQRQVVRSEARQLAKDFRRGDEWDAAGTAARGPARDAVLAGAGADELEQAWASEKTAETYRPWAAVRDVANDAARDAELAAEALTVRDLLTRDKFELLFMPMRSAGIDPDRLVPDRFGPNSAEVFAFIDLLSNLSAVQVAQAGAAGQFVGWSSEQKAEWNAALHVAEDAAGKAERRTAQRSAWETALAAAALDKKTLEAAPWDPARRAAALAQPIVMTAVEALVVRDIISPREFELLFAPMRACGIDPDQLLSRPRRQPS